MLGIAARGWTAGRATRRSLSPNGKDHRHRARHGDRAPRLLLLRNVGTVWFPGTRSWAWQGSSLSPGLAKMVARAGAAVLFAKAAALLTELAGVALTTKRIERSAESDGAAARAAISAGADAICSRQVIPLPPPAPLPDILYVAIDGTGVPMVPAETKDRPGKGPDGRARTPKPSSPAGSPRPPRDADGRPRPQPRFLQLPGPPSPQRTSSARWWTPRHAAGAQSTSASSPSSATARFGSWDLADELFPVGTHLIADCSHPVAT